MAQQIPTVRLGDTVIYYRGGDRRFAIPAIVTQLEVGGASVSLSTFPVNSVTMQPRRGVRHISDPIFDLYPHQKREFGAWDTVENHEKYLSKKEREEQARKERMLKALEEEQKREAQRREQEGSPDEDIEYQIVQLWEKGKTPEEISKAIGRKAWTVDRVTEKLIELNLLNIP